jgi:hypothetical protein
MQSSKFKVQGSKLVLLAGFCIILLLSACGLLEPDAKAWPPAFDDVMPVIARSCVVCHSTETIDGLLSSVRELEDNPHSLDSTEVTYSKQLVLDEVAVLADKMVLYPLLDFSNPENLHHYANDIMQKRDMLCRKIQFHYFRPHSPTGMPPPYTAVLKKVMHNATGRYLEEWGDPASIIGSWKDAHVDFEAIVTFDSSTAFYTDFHLQGMFWPLPTDSTVGFWRRDSIFSVMRPDSSLPETSLVATVALTNDTLVFTDPLGRFAYPFTKALPDEILAYYTSDFGPVSRMERLGLSSMVTDQCAFCHTLQNFLVTEDKFDVKNTPFYKKIHALPVNGFSVKVKHHPGGIARQLKSLGNAMVFVTTADYSKEENVEQFLSSPVEARVTAQMLQYPLYHDWYARGMPPPWTKDILKAIDPTGALYPFIPLSLDKRKLILTFLEANLNVDAFKFDGLDLNVLDSSSDVGQPWDIIHNPDLKAPPCCIEPFFPDEEADSLAS